ncbi:MAG: DUF3142 domain-containing protein [Gammaproteobacteria bacterium]
MARDRRSRAAAVVLLAATLAGCPAPAPLPDGLYLWQRAWTPAVGVALEGMRGQVHELRVQALAVAGDGRRLAIRVEPAVLAGARVPIFAVIRIEGARLFADADPLVTDIVALAARWRAAGVPLAGIEIDHDCASAAVADYGRWLARLRAELAPELALWHTALPAWLDAPGLDRLLAAVDGSVLQVHNVDPPARGLFDPLRAWRWVRDWSARSPRPFRVALPAYGLRVGYDGRGRLLGAEAEIARTYTGAGGVELAADPAAVAAFARRLDRERPARLQGLMWFRLPLAEDARAWSAATLRAAMARAAMTPRFEVAVQGGTDIVVRNLARFDAAEPARIVVRAHCDAGDAADGYALVRRAGWNGFTRDRTRLLRAGERRRIGWLRCARLDESRILVMP